MISPELSRRAGQLRFRPSIVAWKLDPDEGTLAAAVKRAGDERDLDYDEIVTMIDSGAIGAWQRGEAVVAADFVEKLHPRDHKGRFTDKPDLPGFGAPLTKADAFVGQRVVMLSDTKMHTPDQDSGRGKGTVHFVIDDLDAYTKGEKMDPTLAPKGAKWAVRVEWPDGASTVENPAKLTPVEDPTAVKAKIVGEEEHTALFGYEDGGYRNTNSLLRKGRLIHENPAATDTALRNKVRKQIASLDKAIDEQPPLDHAITVFRGTNGEHFTDVKAGDVLTDKGFMSASLASGVARGFARGSPVASLTITVPAGSKVMSVNGALNRYNAEEEVVFPRGTKFVVESVSTAGVNLLDRGIGSIFVHMHAEPPDA
jgi:hypothetical protein